MRIEYFPQTDTVYIDLAGRTGVDAREIADGVLVDLDQASHVLDLTTLEVRRLPLKSRRATG